MRGFFSQFGDVTNLRLSRSKRTGNSKGYAFVEFADADVARIAAATMDRYLMHGKQLVAHVAPPELADRPGLFKGSDKPFKKRLGGSRAAREPMAWIFRGGESRRGRGRDADISRVAARPRVRRGYSEEAGRGAAAAGA